MRQDRPQVGDKSHFGEVVISILGKSIGCGAQWINAGIH